MTNKISALEMTRYTEATPRGAAHLAGPAVGSGVLMAIYLLLRPYGDAAGGDTLQAAAAFASPWWIVAHLCGAAALVSFARLALRMSEVMPSLSARLARWSGLAGAVLVLPYYGAETFALHVLGRHALAGDSSALSMVAPIRDQPVALTTFGLGLLLLALSGILVAIAWQRHHPVGSPGLAAWPLGIMVALVLPQFFLPVGGRMAFGVFYACAAVLLALVAARAHATPERSTVGP